MQGAAARSQAARVTSPAPPRTIRAGTGFGIVGGIPDHETPIGGVITVWPVPQMKWGLTFSDPGQGRLTKGGWAVAGAGKLNGLYHGHLPAMPAPHHSSSCSQTVGVVRYPPAAPDES